MSHRSMLDSEYKVEDVFVILLLRGHKGLPNIIYMGTIFFAVCKEGSKIFQNYNTYIA